VEQAAGGVVEEPDVAGPAEQDHRFILRSKDVQQHGAGSDLLLEQVAEGAGPLQWRNQPLEGPHGLAAHPPFLACAEQSERDEPVAGYPELGADLIEHAQLVDRRLDPGILLHLADVVEHLVIIDAPGGDAVHVRQARIVRKDLALEKARQKVLGIIVALH